MDVDYKKLTKVMLTQLWPRLVDLTEQHRKDNNLTDETTAVDWEAITKPGLFTIGLFFITAIFKREQDKELIIFYITIAAQRIGLSEASDQDMTKYLSENFSLDKSTENKIIQFSSGKINFNPSNNFLYK